MAEKNDLTPMMRQYQEIKAEYPDDVLFFRLGDFYEMFDSDAIMVSRLLNLTLTHRGAQPMCGIPYHAAKSYLKRLLDAGKKVAICEQINLSENSKELAKRQVVQVYTPGTVIEDEYLDSFSDNFILAFDICKGEYVAAFCDISTGAFFAKRLKKDSSFSSLASLMGTLSIAEILVCDDLYFTNRTLRQLLDQEGSVVTKLPSWNFSVKEGKKQLKLVMKAENVTAFGLDENDTLLSPAGALLGYVSRMSRSELTQIDNLRIVDESGFLLMDDSTIKNLEIVKSLQYGSSSYTLFSSMNQTKTAAGSRLLKEVLLQPLNDEKEINRRLDWTQRLYDSVDERNRVRKLLSESSDLIRLSSKFEMKRSVVRDLIAVKESLFSFFRLVSDNSSYLELLDNSISSPERLLELARRIDDSINPECTNERDSGKIIKDGYDAQLDSLRLVHSKGAGLLDDYLEKIKKGTGITILKIGENKIIGTYIEVPKGQVSRVPEYFTRRQTLVGGERYTTPELMEIEARISSALADADARERELYLQIVQDVSSVSHDLLAIGHMLARLDLFQSFAQTASLYGYVRPQIVREGELEILDSRHPVVEQYIERGGFVRNSFSSSSSRFALITGPNMAGKSTFLRQNALIILMAHAGSFVPASKAVIPLTDRIFCRVGASDNLARGESTFLVEMQEAAFILRNATRKSFVIMDEIGRGTSTQDGMSLAYAIMMSLVETGCVTLFATHYHELTMIDTSRMQLLTLEVSQEKNNIVFLRKVIEGVAESSYGLHVAKMAGVPSSVIREASAFQKKHFADYNSSPMSSSQLDLFIDATSAENSELNSLLDDLMDFDVSSSTPIEAMNLVSQLQKKVTGLKKD